MTKWCVLILCVVTACAKNETSADPAAPAAKAKESALAAPAPASPEHAAGPAAVASGAPAAPVAAAPQPPAPAPAVAPADGQWAHFASKNEVPLCVFADYPQYEKTNFLKDVKRTVKTRAHDQLVFGVYAPTCASKECVSRPGMQCWAEIEDHTITVQSRYNGEQRVGATCTKDCESVMAACDTPVLLPGTYTLHYGDTTTTIKVPGTLRPACITPK
jgi:hypothetical protein